MTPLSLIQMHGVPGSGKSTLARALGAELGALVAEAVQHLRSLQNGHRGPMRQVGS